MKKLKLLSAILATGLLLTGCASKPSEDALKFKEDYEKLNGVETSREGVYYRTITIDENNPFVYETLENVNKKIENKESFIVYFGANWCPWCRSVLPTAIKEAKNAKIDKIYYIDVRPDNKEDNDIRDLYSVDDKEKTYLSHEGTDAYHKFLEYAHDVLADYSLHGVKVENVKRVGAPNFILVKDGKVTEKITGISSDETDPYMELTDKIKEDMSNNFKEFYKKL